MSASDAVVLPGLILTSLGIGLALPTASIAITSGVRREDQGLEDADVHEPAHGITPVPVLAECQLRKC